MSDHKKYHNGHIPVNDYDSLQTTSSINSEHQEDEEINLKQLLFSLWNRKWMVIGSVILFGFLAWMIALFTTPIYESEGSLLINQPQSSFSGLNLGGGGGALGDILSSSYGIGNSSSLDNELEILKSRRLSIAVADSLTETRDMPNGKQYPIIFKKYPDDATVLGKDTVAARLREKLVFQKVESNANVIDVLFESPSAVEAGEVINVVLATYKNLSSAQNRTSASSAGSFLRDEQARVKENLRRSEEDLREFMNESDLVQVDAQTQELITQMADLEARRQEARGLLVAAKSGIERYRNELNVIKPGLAEQYAEAVGPDISRLQYAKSELEVEKQQLLANNPRLTPSEPEIREIDRKIQKYKNRILELTQKVINENDRYLSFLGGEGSGIAQGVSTINQKLIELQVQRSQSQSQIDVITTQLEELQQFFNNLPDNIIALARLKRDVKINEEMFLAVTQQYAQTTLWEQSQYGLGRVIDDGYIPKEPARPNLLLYIIIGLLFGAIVSIGYVFALDALNTIIMGADKIEKLDSSLLALIPDLGKYSKNPYAGTDFIDVQGTEISTRLVPFLEPDKPASEVYRQLENKLIYADNENNGKSILLTSAAKGEGKTTTTANLGIVLAEAGFDTLILDADFRQPAMHTVFGINRKPGIAEIIANKATLSDSIQPTVMPGLSVLSAGLESSNAAALSRDKAFLKLIQKVERQFDYVLIDTAPFGITTDAAPLLRQAGDVILIAKFGQTSTVQFRQTLNQLRSLNAQIKGTVLTSYDTAKSNDTDPKYHNRYIYG